MTTQRDSNYNKGKPIKCECGKIIAYVKDGKLWLYCKKCRKQIPIEPEP